MKISKARFLDYMDRVLKYLEREEKLSDALVEYCDDIYFFTPRGIMDLLVDMLIDLTGDNKEDPIIVYWMYELNYGKDWKEDSITEMDGTSIKLQTPEDLYNYLVRYNEDKNKNE